MRISLARWISLVSYVGLIAWVMAWIVFMGEVERQHISLLLVLCVPPLLLPLRGVLNSRDKALIWGTLVSLAYTVHGSMVVWIDPAQRWLGLVEVALSLGYLISASLFIRWRADQKTKSA